LNATFSAFYASLGFTALHKLRNCIVLYFALSTVSTQMQLCDLGMSPVQPSRPTQPPTLSGWENDYGQGPEAVLLGKAGNHRSGVAVAMHQRL